MKPTVPSYMLLLCYATLFCYAISYCSCHPKSAPQGATLSPQGATSAPQGATSTPRSRVFNQENKDDQGQSQLLGKCTRERLEQAPYDSWFIKNYMDYTVDSATAEQLRSKLIGKKLLIFMGTWCGDSQREVPRIFKILDYCGIDTSVVQLVMVSDADSIYKQSPGHEERGLNIFRVPDLIVVDQGKELGRIVESPVLSLEKDLLALAGGDQYIPHYQGAALLVKVFREEKSRQIEKELPELAARVKPLVRSPSELKSYARVLKAAGEGQEADIALRINALIFPAGK